MGNMYDFSDITSQMFDKKDRSAETLRRLQMMEYEDKINERKREREYQGGLADYIRSNEGRARSRTETTSRMNPEDINAAIGAGEAGAFGIQPPQPVTTTKEIPAEISLAGLAREGAMKMGRPDDALKYGKMEGEERNEKSKARSDELKVMMDFQKQFAEIMKSGNPSQLDAFYSQFEDDPTLGKTVKKLRGQNIELSGPDEFTTVMDIKEKTVKNPIDGTWVPAGKYKVKQKNGKFVSAEPFEGKTQDRYEDAGYGRMYDKKEDKFVPKPEKPDKPDKAGGEDGNAKMAQVGKVEKVIVNVNQGFLDLAVKNPDNKNIAEDLRSGTIKNIRPYLTKGQQDAYDAILERAQVNSRTMEPAQAYQEALRWYKTETKGGVGVSSPPKTKTENKSEMSAMPPARQHSGKTIRDTVTGTRYKSDGMKWVEIK